MTRENERRYGSGVVAFYSRASIHAMTMIIA
jgi:hypothetical protein